MNIKIERRRKRKSISTQKKKRKTRQPKLNGDITMVDADTDDDDDDKILSTIEKKERKKRKIIIYFCHYSLENIYIFFRRLIRVKNGIWKKTHIFRTLQVWWWSSYCDFHMSTCCFHMKITIIHHMHAPYAEFRFF